MKLALPILMATPLILLALGSTAAPTQTSTSISPIATTSDTIRRDWADDILDLVEKLIETLEEAEEQTEEPQEDEMTNTADLRLALNDALGIINDLFDPHISPSLTPTDAGSIDAGADPETLAEYADTCLALAYDSEAEILTSTDYDQELIGSNLKTIRHLIIRSSPHNYRTKAGIETSQ